MKALLGRVILLLLMAPLIWGVFFALKTESGPHSPLLLLVGVVLVLLAGAARRGGDSRVSDR